MSYSPAQTRLASVDAVRGYQRVWLEETRRRVLDGDHFAICNADDFEEIFTAFDIPAMVINYWNSVVTFSERKGPHYDKVLEEHGYVAHRFAHGMGTTLDTSQAPWGGLPKPTLIVGTTRDEAQLRVCELWAEAFDCECYMLDFSWVSQYTHPLPVDWWNYHRDRSESMLDLKRVALRLEQMKALIAHIEAKIGRPFSLARFREIMELLNAQMDVWEAARDVVAQARPLPVSLRDQMALYQVTWQRGTPQNLELVNAYYEEAKVLAEAGTGCYAQERFRIYMATSGNDPQWHNYLRERYGGVVVSPTATPRSRRCMRARSWATIPCAPWRPDTCSCSTRSRSGRWRRPSAGARTRWSRWRTTPACPHAIAKSSRRRDCPIWPCRGTTTARKRER